MCLALIAGRRERALVKEGRAAAYLSPRRIARSCCSRRPSLTPAWRRQRIEPDGRQFQLIKRGSPKERQLQAGDSVALVGIEVEPREQDLSPGQSQQLRVTAVASDGTRTSVTADAEYSSNAELIAACDARGLIQAGHVAGQAAILVRDLVKFALARIMLPRKLQASFSRPPEANFIDHDVWNQLERLGIEPSPAVGDDCPAGGCFSTRLAHCRLPTRPALFAREQRP